MRYGSVCSGIEAASAAWHPLGWEPVFFSEIEAFPCAVLAHHYPNTPNLGDMAKFEEWPDATLDVLVGGTPCQSFSVAGLRKGLDDPRGNLMLTFGAIARKYRPEWLVWENVPGVLSSNGGRDFGTFLGMLGELGYGFAYRVLDAQYFGVAQRRRRVFVIGCLGGWRRAAAVLFERHSLSWHPAPSREAGKVAPTIPSRSSGGGGLGTDFDCDGGLIHAGPIARCVTTGEARRQDWETCNFVAQSFAIQAGALRTNPSSGPDGVGVQTDHAYTLEARAEVQAVCVTGDRTHALTAEGFDASEDGTGRGNPVIAFSAKDYGGDAIENLSPTLRAGGHHGSHANAGVMPAIAFHPTQDPISSIDGSTHAIGCGSSQGQASVAVAVALRGREGGATAELGDEVGHTLRASSGGGDKPHVLAPSVAVAVRDISQTLTSNYGKQVDSSDTGLGPNVVFPHMQVRRLTPVECARLQGFPDHYLDITYRGKPAADGPKYKALGNSMAVPVMRWIGERLQMVSEIKAVEYA